MRLVRIDAEVYVDDSHDGEDIALALWSLPGVVRVRNAEVAHVVTDSPPWNWQRRTKTGSDE